MVALVVFLVLIAAVAALSWWSRGRPMAVRCCNPAAWPPDDLTRDRAAEQPEPGKAADAA